VRFHEAPREAQEKPFKGILIALHPYNNEALESTHRFGGFGAEEEQSGREHRQCSWACAFTHPVLTCLKERLAFRKCLLSLLGNPSVDSTLQKLGRLSVCLSVHLKALGTGCRVIPANVATVPQGMALLGLEQVLP